jgi:hypothetical protein
MKENFLKNRKSKQVNGRIDKNRFRKPKNKIDKNRFSQNNRQEQYEERKMALSSDNFPLNQTYSSSDTRPTNYFKPSYLQNYFSSNIPKNCKNSTYIAFIETLKDQELDNKVMLQFNDPNFFHGVHGKLISIGYEENENLRHKLGSYTVTTANNSWQFGRAHKQCPTFRNSSETYSDLELEIMSSTVNCPDLTKKTKKKDNLYLDEELFIELEDVPEDLKGYTDLSVQKNEFLDEGYRPVNFSNGRVYFN